MKTIKTSDKGWQKEMEKCMSNEEKFILVTKEEKLAKTLERGKIKMGDLKLILFGTGAAAAVGAGGAAIVGVSGIAAVGATTGLLAIADPEPISKTTLAAITAICAALGSYFVYRLVEIMIKEGYEWEAEKEGDVWRIKGKPKTSD